MIDILSWHWECRELAYKIKLYLTKRFLPKGLLKVTFFRMPTNRERKEKLLCGETKEKSKKTPTYFP